MAKPVRTPTIEVDRHRTISDDPPIGLRPEQTITFFLPGIEGKPGEQGRIDVRIVGRTLEINTSDKVLVMSVASNHVLLTTVPQLRQLEAENDVRREEVRKQDAATSPLRKNRTRLTR